MGGVENSSFVFMLEKHSAKLRNVAWSQTVKSYMTHTEEFGLCL